MNLSVLRGRPAPKEVVGDLSLLLQLPPAAREHLWDALAPSLREPVTRQAEAALDHFCSVHRVDADVLASAVRASRFLLRAANDVGATKQELAGDLATLCAASPEIAELLLARFDAAMALLAEEALDAALVDHGRVLVDVDWRVDAVRASSRGGTGAGAVALFTFRVKDGDDESRVTVQVRPEVAKKLRWVCDRVLQEAATLAG
jgi:hypothetical protein